jgi:hypothetical protein
MRTATKKNAVPRTLDLRDRLKVLMEKDLKGLPKLLEGLEGKDRLDVIPKLMPLAMPRAKPIDHEGNESKAKAGRLGGLKCAALAPRSIDLTQ